MSSAACDLSIVVVTYNSRAVIERCLGALAAGAGALSTEVIVVDNASTDGTPELLAQRREVKLVRSARNVGFARAANAGIAASRGRHVLLLNPDTRATPGALEHLAAGLEKFSNVGLAGPSLANPTDDTVRPSLAATPTIGWLFYRFTPAKYLPRVGAKRGWAPIPDVPIDAGYLNGSCLLIRRSMFEQIGGLDEEYFLYWEDIEYSRRAIALGWKLLWTSSATVYHARALGSTGIDPGLRHWLGLVGARRYFAQNPPRGLFPAVWQLFKLFHLAGMAITCAESRIKATTYAIGGNQARSQRHRRRWREASAFLRRYSRKFLRL